MLEHSAFWELMVNPVCPDMKALQKALETHAKDCAICSVLAQDYGERVMRAMAITKDAAPELFHRAMAVMVGPRQDDPEP